MHHHICILGGTGFVGRHLAARLVRDGHRVRVLARRTAPHRDLLVLPTLELVECNVHDEDALHDTLAGCDVVINLIGILNEKSHTGRGFCRAHVELAHKLVVAAQDNGITRLLHMSALNADADNGSSYYLRSKGEAENLVHMAKKLSVTSFRPSVIFGHDDSFFNRFAGLLKRLPLFFPLACAGARFAPVYVGDVVECFARAIDNRATWGQRYDLCGPRNYTLKQLVHYTARQLGLRRFIVALPGWASWLQAFMLEFVPGKPFSRDNLNSMRTDSVCSDDFPSIFSITPRSIESEVPTYLNGGGMRSRYPLFRSQARRD
jgi:uncharacterized protein YbjT (DUF2867 family)